MHDIKAIREDPTAYDRGWAKRGLKPKADIILEFDQKLRAAQTLMQEAQARRNDLSRQIGQAKAQKNEAEASRLMAEVEQLKSDIAGAFEAEAKYGSALRELVASLPNIPAADVPEGVDETANVERRRWGEPRAIAAPRDHVALGEGMGGMDFESAVRMSGSRFVVLKGQLARLERAIGQFLLDTHTLENGYTEVQPPLLVLDEAVFGTGQLPKFENDLFASTDGDLFRRVKDLLAMRPEAADQIPGMIDDATRRWLIPTAEVSLTNLVREQILDDTALPMRLTALTPCFRAEAGASGRDTRGMIRQHQFNKVELVSITTPEQSADEHERMTACAEGVLKRLDLPFRTMLLCAGDMGFSARKTYDLEVWLPSQGTYREISSCSNCGDWQARRMDARSRTPGEKGTRFVHTLNGSGVAVGRALIAVMENYQDEGGRIAVPDALKPYMGGLGHIG